MALANPYVATPAGVTPTLTCGQWVKVDGHVKPGRFVRYNADGTAFIVSPVGKGKRARVSMAAFRLACGKPLAKVISTAQVKGRVVHNTIEGDTVDLTPVGPAEDREARLQRDAEAVTPNDVIDLLADFM